MYFLIKSRIDTRAEEAEEWQFRQYNTYVVDTKINATMNELQEMVTGETEFYREEFMTVEIVDDYLALQAMEKEKAIRINKQASTMVATRSLDVPDRPEVIHRHETWIQEMGTVLNYDCTFEMIDGQFLSYDQLPAWFDNYIVSE